jgi:hypothetical protein
MKDILLKIYHALNAEKTEMIDQEIIWPYILMVIAGVGVAITLSLIIWLVVDFIIKEVNVALILLGM